MTQPEGSMSLRAAAGQKPRRRRQFAPVGLRRAAAAERHAGRVLRVRWLAADVAPDALAA
jgi:hypothetical protein